MLMNSILSLLGSSSGKQGGGTIISDLAAFNVSDRSSSGSYSGALNLLGEMGDTGRVKFVRKTKFSDYLILAGSGFLIYSLFK